MKFDGWLLEKKTDEAKAQLELERARIDAVEEREQAAFEKAVAAGGATSAVSAADDEFKLDPTIRNQFDFAERASQTFNLTLRERNMSTEPPPSATINGELLGPYAATPSLPRPSLPPPHRRCSPWLVIALHCFPCRLCEPGGNL